MLIESAEKSVGITWSSFFGGRRGVEEDISQVVEFLELIQVNLVKYTQMSKKQKDQRMTRKGLRLMFGQRGVVVLKREWEWKSKQDPHLVGFIEAGAGAACSFLDGVYYVGANTFGDYLTVNEMG